MNQKNPYAPPSAPVSDVDQADSSELQYAGFWIRVGASIIDAIIIWVIIIPLFIMIYGMDALIGDNTKFVQGPADFLLSWVFPAVWSIVFWVTKGATPGKMALSLKVVDANTGGPISTGKAIGRYLCYYVSMLVFFLGYMWVGWDRRKQGWHDKIARTLVVRS